MIDERSLLAAIKDAWRTGGYSVVGNGGELVLRQVRGRVLLDVATYKANERVFSTPTQDIPAENGMLWVPAGCVRADRRSV